MPDDNMLPEPISDATIIVSREKRHPVIAQQPSGLALAAKKVLGWLRQSAILLVGIAISTSALAQTPVSGAIAVDTRWTAANSPYVVSGDVVVQNAAVLTIDSGVTVYMAPGAGLAVEAGSIRASGVASSPIRVLSYKTRQGLAAAPGDWKQWVFNPGTVNTRLDYVSFENGSGLAVNGSAPVFNYLILNNHQGAAISANLNASPTGVGNQANGNTINGIAVPAGDIGGSVRWGLRGIPYVIASGTVSVGASPSVSSIGPNSFQQGETVTLNISGTRLSGLSSAVFAKTGISAQVLPGASDSQASLLVTADVTTAIGATDLKLQVDAGEIRVPGAITVNAVQPVFTSLSPALIYTGQGSVDVVINGRNLSSQSVALVNGVSVPTTFLSATQIRASIQAPALAGNLLVKLSTPDPLNAGQFLASNELTLPVAPAQLLVTPSPATLVKGATKPFTITLPYAAPVGGITVSLVSSVPSVASVPATLLIPAGQTSAIFQLNATDLGATVITASKVGFASGQAQVTVIAPPTLTFTPGTAALGIGRSLDLTLRLSAPAGPSGLYISFTSSDSSVAGVSTTAAALPPGETAVTITVTTFAIGNATITAQAADYANGVATIAVRPLSLNLPAGVLVAPGLSRSIPLTLSDPAPAGGLVINLVSGNAAIATVPTSVTVSAGQTNANFNLTGVAAGSTSIIASASGGYQSASVQATVDAVTISIGSPVVSSITMPVDITSASYALTLSKPAPTGGVTINLAISDPTKATVSPSSITISAGQTSGGVQLFTVTGVASGSTTLSASAAGLNSASVPITVTGKPQLVFSTPTVTVGKALKTYLYEVYVSRRTDNVDYYPNQALTVSLTSSDPSKASVPTTVTIPAGSNYAPFYVTGVDLTAGVPVTVDATATGYNAAATKLSVNVVAPQFSLNGLETSRSSASPRDDFRIYTYTPGAAYSGNQTAAGDLPINLAIVEGAPTGIVDGFYSAASGGTAVTQVLLRNDLPYSDVVYVGVPTAAGTYKVQATAPGIATSTSGVTTVTAPEFRFSTNSVTVGKGLKTYYYEVYVYRAVNGASFNGTDAVTVNLTSSDASKASVPTTVTIPAGSNYAPFYVTGVDLTAGVPVTVDATATGYNAAPVKLSVNVVAPQFRLDGLETSRSTSSPRDDFRIYTSTPGAAYSGNQTAAGDLPINLSIVYPISETAPANIVDGFYSAASGGTAVTQVLLRNDLPYSDVVYVGVPTAAGTYKVQATAPGIATSTSGVTTVTAPEFRFSTNSVTVGKGLKTYYYEVYVYRAVNGASFNGTDAVTVNLTSSDASKASVPATVTIPAGSNYTPFYVTGVDLTAGSPVTIDATATGYNAAPVKLSVNVVAPQFTFRNLDASRSLASPRDDFYIDFYTPGAAYSGNQTAASDLPIYLSIVEGAPAGIVNGFFLASSGGTPITQVQLSTGYTYSGPIFIGTPTSSGSYKVQASVAGVTGTSGAVTVTTPELRFSTSSVTVGLGLRTYYYEVNVYRAVNAAAFNGTDAITVNLTCTSTAICSVPASITIPAGQSTAYFPIDGVGLGSTTLTASAVGYNATQDLAVNVVNPQLNFSGPGSGKVGTQNIFQVYLTTPGAAYSGNQAATGPLLVNLTSSSPGVATVADTVTIRAGSVYSDGTPLTGVSAGTTTITASGSNLSSATTSVITVNP